MKTSIDINKVSDKIGFPISEWPGKCYGVAMSIFANNINAGFAQHGWVELEDGRIWDPTRWAFENVNPYVYVGANDHYDIGGSKIRKRFKMPCPRYDESKNKVTLKLNVLAMALLQEILDDFRQGGTFTVEQIHWAATESPDVFGSQAKHFYKELKRVDMNVFVPIDYWRFIME